jgi:hypothetical protein
MMKGDEIGDAVNLLQRKESRRALSSLLRELETMDRTRAEPACPRAVPYSHAAPPTLLPTTRRKC